MPDSDDPRSTLRAAWLPLAVGAIVGVGLGIVTLLLFVPTKVEQQAIPAPALAATQSKPAPNPTVGEAAAPETPAPQVATPPPVVSRPPMKVEPVLSEAETELNMKLRSIALAIMNFEAVHRELPPKFDPERPPRLLSWRVELLPFLEQQALYEQFRLDEPWDSAHNRALLPKMPEVFRTPGVEPGTTRLLGFSGADLLFQAGKKVRLRDCQDGLSNTLLVVYAAKGVPWTKPDDLKFDAKNPHRGIGQFEGKLRGVLLDCSPLAVPPDLPADQLAALVTPHGGEVIDGHGVQVRYAGLASAAELSTAESSVEPSSTELSPEVAPEVITKTELKLRSLALAMLNYESTHQAFPPWRRGTAEGVGLSWRVHLLPYLEQENLYKLFKLNEPWDSPHNRELLTAMPDVFRLGAETTTTHFQVITGDKTLFKPDRPATMRACADGTSNTLLIAVAKSALPWTAPQEIRFDATEPRAGFGVLNNRLRGVLVDGGLVALPQDVESETLTALITPAGKEIVDGPGLYQRYAERAASRNHYQDQQLALNRLKTIILALHNYHDTQGRFPPAWQEIRATPQQRGRPAVSWRVLLLPFLEHQNLYDQYDQSLAWDHPHNLALVEKMPTIFHHEGDESWTTTRLQMFSSAGAMGRPPDPESPTRASRSYLSVRAVTDGVSKTLHVVEGGPETAVPWTKPGGLELDPQAPLAALGKLDPRGFPCAMADGSARWLTPDIDPAEFRSLVLYNDGK